MTLDIARSARKALEDGCDFFERGDFRRAARRFLVAAKAGFPEAQVNLANLYDCGEGVRKDFSKAAYWYRKAIKAGCCYGASGLASSYRDRGQIRWAVFWFRKAISMGDDWAQEDLSELLDRKRIQGKKGPPISRPVSSARPKRSVSQQ